jgi:hypothetical protein
LHAWTVIGEAVESDAMRLAHVPAFPALIFRLQGKDQRFHGLRPWRVGEYLAGVFRSPIAGWLLPGRARRKGECSGRDQ